MKSMDKALGWRAKMAAKVLGIPLALTLLAILILILAASSGFLATSLAFGVTFAWVILLVYFIFIREEEVQKLVSREITEGLRGVGLSLRS